MKAATANGNSNRHSQEKWANAKDESCTPAAATFSRLNVFHDFSTT